MTHRFKKLKFLLASFARIVFFCFVFFLLNQGDKLINFLDKNTIQLKQ